MMTRFDIFRRKSREKPPDVPLPGEPPSSVEASHAAEAPPPLSAASDIKGFVDQYRANSHSLSGWATQPSGEPVTVVALYDGLEVARADAVHDRPTQKGVQFFLPLPNDVSPEGLQSGRLVVMDKDRTKVLDLWSGFRYGA